jgi:hypothetical protein
MVNDPFGVFLVVLRRFDCGEDVMFPTRKRTPPLTPMVGHYIPWQRKVSGRLALSYDWLS